MATFILFFLGLFTDDQPDSFVKEYRTEITVVNGKKKVKTFLSFQINNKDGLKHSEASLWYTEGSPINNLKARIISMDGQVVRQLKNKDITKRKYLTSISSFGDDYLLEFELIHNQYPYILEYSYEQTFKKFLWIDKWTPNYNNLFTSYAELIVNLPQDYLINISSNGIDNKEPVRNIDGTITHRWTAKNSAKIKRQTLAPHWRDLSPRVYVTPKTINYGVKGSAGDWQGYGKWISDLGNGYNDMPKTEINRLKVLVKDAQNKREIIQRVYNYMQDEMRYINVALDIGGMKPYPASYVSTNRYGDCKALTYYMKSALEAFDINSYPVDIYWDDTPEALKTELPAQQFNHIFLAVPLEMDTIWLENTSKYYPYNYLDVAKKGQRALWIDDQKSTVITITTGSDKEVLNERKINLMLKSDDTLVGSVMYTHRGDKYEALKGRKIYWNSADLDSWVKRNYTLGNGLLSSWEFLDHGRNDASVGLKSSVSVNGLIKKYGPNRVVELPKSEIEDFEQPKKRTQPLLMRSHFYQIDSISVGFDPNTFAKVTYPNDTLIQSRFGLYTITSYKNKESVLVRREVKINPGEISPDSVYTEFYDFISTIKTLDNSNKLVLKP